MTLREEIQDILKLNMMFYQAEMQTNLVLKIIEKRIDEIQKSFEARSFYHDEGENTGHPVTSGIDMFYSKVKEMLKS